MKNRFAKFFSIILVITMMAGTLPVSRAVYAAENETAAETKIALTKLKESISDE